MRFIKKVRDWVKKSGQQSCKKNFRLAQARGRAVCNDAMALVEQYRTKSAH